MAEINRQLFRINHTLDDLLVFARPSKPAFKEVNLNKVIKAIMPIIKSQPACDSILFDYNTTHENQLVNGDSKLINQLFWNVLSNAIQAMDVNGKLTVRISQNKNSIQVTVTDTGVGIREEDMGSIFNSFFTTKAKGTGLGLAVTKQILDIHHATISFESQVGVGTTVTINFLRMSEETT